MKKILFLFLILCKQDFLYQNLRLKIYRNIHGSKVEGDFLATATHGVSILEWDDGSGALKMANTLQAMFLIIIQNNLCGKSWSQENGEYAALYLF